MVVGSLVMAAAVAVTALVAMMGRMPSRSRAGHDGAHDGAHHEDESGGSRVRVMDVVYILIFAVAGGFAFNVLANAGG